MRDKINRKQNAAFKALSVDSAPGIIADTRSVLAGDIPSASSRDGQKLLVSDKIIRISKASDNLCFYNCMLQSLRTVEERNAFAAFNPSDVTKAFIELSRGQKHRVTGKIINRNKHGYLSVDIERYLRYLKNNSFIKAFKFETLQGITFKTFLEKLFIKLPGNEKEVEEQVFIFMGWTLPAQEKEAMRKRFENRRKSLISTTFSDLSGEEQRIAVERELIEYYEGTEDMAAIRKRYSIGKFEHGVSIGLEKDKSLWLYDNGNLTRKRVTSVADVAPYLLTYWRIFAFNLTV